MGRVRRQFRRSVAAGLAVWMTVVGFGVSVSHAHPAAGSSHVHGFGWNGTSEPSPADGPAHPHRHLILLGVELPGEFAPDKGPTDRGCEAAVGTACDAPESPAAAPDLSAAGVVELRAPTREPAAAVVATAAPTLSAFARHVTPGVLRS